MLIARFKVHPFIALILASGFLGLVTGLPVAKVVKEFQDGFGGTLGFVGVLLGLGTMLGKLMAESGGADRIARTLVDAFGEAKVHWAMMISAFLVGIPLFFEIGFVLLAPLVFIVARRSGVSLIKIGIPLLAGLSVVHGMVPPHPGPLLAIGAFGADIGKTIFYGLLVGLPTAILAGPVYGAWIAKRVPGDVNHEVAATLSRHRAGEDGGRRTSRCQASASRCSRLLLPVALMLAKTLADVLTDDQSPVRQWMDFIGNPIVALLAALLVGLYTFGFARGLSAKEVGKQLDAEPAAGRGHPVDHRRRWRLQADADRDRRRQDDRRDGCPPPTSRRSCSRGWSQALIRIATGVGHGRHHHRRRHRRADRDAGAGRQSRTAGVATGAGSLILSHVNDAGFWLVKQYFGLTLAETFKTWTAMETIISVVGIVLIMILSAFV